MHVIVEGDDQHLVVDMNLIDEANGFVLDLFQPVNGAVAGVQEQSHGEGGVHRGEVGDLLLDPVLVDPEVFLCQVGQVSTVGVGHHHVDIDQVHVHRERVGISAACRISALLRISGSMPGRGIIVADRAILQGILCVAGYGLHNQPGGPQSFQGLPDRLVDAETNLALRDEVEDPILGGLSLPELLNQVLELVPGKWLVGLVGPKGRNQPATGEKHQQKHLGRSSRT